MKSEKLPNPNGPSDYNLPQNMLRLSKIFKIFKIFKFSNNCIQKKSPHPSPQTQCWSLAKIDLNGELQTNQH